jgi:hypothetical protein
MNVNYGSCCLIFLIRELQNDLGGGGKPIRCLKILSELGF